MDCVMCGCGVVIMIDSDGNGKSNSDSGMAWNGIAYTLNRAITI